MSIALTCSVALGSGPPCGDRVAAVIVDDACAEVDAVCAAHVAAVLDGRTHCETRVFTL